MQQRVGELVSQLRTIKTPDDTWQRLRLRIARLSGGMGVLRIGAQTFHERSERKEQAKKAMRVLETALEGGIVPGGGVAYLNAISAVGVCKRGELEADAGVDLVLRALRAPFLQIVANDGQESPQVTLNEVLSRGGAVGYDVNQGEFVSMTEAGILDSAVILCAALQTAASAAIMALTTDTAIVER
jgi:chaperonin GroEL